MDQRWVLLVHADHAGRFLYVISFSISTKNTVKFITIASVVEMLPILSTPMTRMWWRSGTMCSSNSIAKQTEA